MSKKDVDREKDLKECFNNAIDPIVSLSVKDKDYYNALSAEQFINLKKALSNINNIITLKTTLAFVDKVVSSYLKDAIVVNKIKENIKSQSANANGFDILCEEGEFHFVAEVKCNIPVKEGQFGAAQLGGIYKDIINLSRGKKKNANVKVQKLNKFMVFLDYGNIDAAIYSLTKTPPEWDSYYIKNLFDKQDKKNQDILEGVWKNLIIIDSDKLPSLPDPDKIYICRVSL